MTNGNAEADPGGRVNLVSVAATVAAAIGTVGWVTFLGGALLWISFGQASLPSAEAVAVVPTSVLVSTGAEFAVAAALAVTVIVLVLFLFDRHLSRRVDHRRLRRLGEARETLHQLRGEMRRAAALAEEKQQAVDGRRAARDQAGDRDARNAAKQELDRAQFELAAAESELEARQDAVFDQTGVVIEASRRSAAWILPVSAGVLVAVAAALGAKVVTLGEGDLPFVWGGVAVLVVAALAGVIAGTLYPPGDEQEVSSADEGDSRALARYRFPLLGLVAFIAIPVVMAVGIYFRAANAPQVEPLAVLRTDGTPVAAFFISETSDRVFLGTFEEPAVECTRPDRCQPQIDGALNPVAVPPRMISLPKSEIRSMSIGPPRPLNAQDAKAHSPRHRPRTAREWAGSAALLLCDEADDAWARHLRSVAASGDTEASPVAQPPPTCSSQHRSNLEEFVTAEQRVIRTERNAGEG